MTLKLFCRRRRHSNTEVSVSETNEEMITSNRKQSSNCNRTILDCMTTKKICKWTQATPFNWSDCMQPKYAAFEVTFLNRIKCIVHLTNNHIWNVYKATLNARTYPRTENWKYHTRYSFDCKVTTSMICMYVVCRLNYSKVSDIPFNVYTYVRRRNKSAYNE